MDKHSAFTTSSQVLKNVLYNEVTLCYNGKSVTVTALWDTGATSSAISHQVANALNLISIGRTIVSTPSGQKEVDTFCIDARLPNNVSFDGVMVFDSEIGSQRAGANPVGMLVGMDIIGKGDFAVTNYNGKTVFTYRYPSVGLIDFVKQIAAQNTIGRLHGKGKRKRK